ncbi:ABC transporter transmembrane domain-containing protein [Actinophytocola xanthii]|uniref:ABC transporter n=1 Tax=Actinophytocola xanthii TaxID=1912961 RepID=A0A1Q8CKP0_9PSEU|nr:ABC transporter ATP-binding protein [Actinophytocola xanthii]OLF14913.1 ABC transporter [Actinophytocola xanthii]
MRLTVPYADPGTPDSRGPGRYLLWLVRRQPARVLLGSLLASAWLVGLVVQPLLLARAIDDGLRTRDLASILLWTAALLAAGAANAGLGVLRHRTMTFIRLDAGFRTVQVVVRHAAAVGAELPRRTSSGEVVSIGAADLDRIMRTMTSTGPGIGAVITYAVVAVLLVDISPVLALVVLLGVPALMLSLASLLRRVRETETAYREQQGALAARAGDIVAGLRVLCGIGGKDRFAHRYRRDSAALREQGYRVGATASWVEGISVGLPSLFLAAVTWLAARMSAAGEITVGEMVAVYGYVAVLATPVFFIIEGALDINRGLVAARRVVRVLALRPAVTDRGTDRGTERGTVPCPQGPAELHDPVSGLTVRPGELLVLAPAQPADALAVVDRLGRFVDSDATWDGAPLAAMPLAEVRRRILVADNDAHLFAGPLREVVASEHDHTDEAIAHAIRSAAAEDVLTGLPAGLGSPVEAQGRNLSGGQRQRVRLVRALLADPEVLILVEPTSAVDAHTEAAAAAGLRTHRRDRTTVVVATSPLLLARADRVAYLLDGRVAATGTHAELLATEPGYRALAHRGEELVP